MDIYQRVDAARLHGVVLWEAKSAARTGVERHAWHTRCEPMELVRPQNLTASETAFLFNFAGLASPPRHDEWTPEFIKSIPRLTKRIARSQGLQA